MIRFIVDSTFGVSKEYAETNNIKIVQLKTVLDGVVRDEGFEPDWEEFYIRLRQSEAFPTTSQPNPEAFSAAISEIYAEDADAEIVLLTIAGNLSGTVNSARIGASAFEGKRIAVIDSQNTSVASHMILEELVLAAQSGKSFDEVVLFCDTLIEKTSVQFVPDTMKYLKKGGRIGTLGALFASIISIKPIFEFKKNTVAIPSKVLGMSKAIAQMIKRLPQKIKKLCVVFISDNKNVPLVVEKLDGLLGIKSSEIKAVSPVFGIHVGIGAVGIACIEA